MSAETVVTTPATGLPPPVAIMIWLPSIQRSKTNPRRTWDKAALEELTESVRSKGILQPILVRPRGDGYELVAGERRWRAAKAAGLDAIPAVVRYLSDQEVLEVQVIENLQRADLHPLEEAEGYEVLIQKHGYAVEDLAAKVGKSKGYVYARLKLCALVPEARKAFYEGKLNPSTALLVARIPVKELQQKATKEIASGDRHGGGRFVKAEFQDPMSVREAAEHIQENYMLRLAEAPWPLADAQLVPRAGACTVCPKRTGNQRELFDDVKSGDVCTDPKCFAEKREAWKAKIRVEAEASGKAVIAGKEAKAIKPHDYSSQLKGYVDLSQRCYNDPKNRQYKTLLGKQVEKAALLEDPHTGELKEVMRNSDVEKALKEKGYTWAASAGRDMTSRVDAHYAAKARSAQDKARLENEVRQRIHDQIRTKVTKLGQADLALVAAAFFEDIWDEHRKRILALWGWGGEKGSRRDVVRNKAHDLDETQLARFLVDLALVKDTRYSAYDGAGPKRLLAAATRYRVDAAAIRKEVLAEAAAKRKGRAKPPATKNRKGSSKAKAPKR